MHVPAVVAHVTFRRVSIRHTTNEARTKRRWCGAMTSHGDNSAQRKLETEAQIRIFALQTHAQTR